MYRVNIAGFGVNDVDVESLVINGLEVTKRGDISNKRTGAVHTENIIRICTTTTYEKGFEPAIDRLLRKIKNNHHLAVLFSQCPYVELQIRVMTCNREFGIPAISISKEQLAYLSTIGACVDVSVL